MEVPHSQMKKVMCVHTYIYMYFKKLCIYIYIYLFKNREIEFAFPSHIPNQFSGTLVLLHTKCRFIAEESTAAGSKCVLTDSPTWIIDPVDGTCNFVHR